MARTMYDSDVPGDIPASAGMVALYIDGIGHVATAQDWARFPSATRVRIAVWSTTNDGDFLDVEPGNASPAQAPGWVKMRRAAGHPFPVVYCYRAERQAVEDALHAAGLTPADVGLAVSTMDGTKTVSASPYGYRVVFVQYADPPASGGHFDLSIVYDDVWPAAHPAAIEPAPVDYPEDNMQQRAGLVEIRNGRGWYPLPAGVSAAHVSSVNVYDVSPDAAGKYVPVPRFAGKATDRNELVFFGNDGPVGPTPDGWYGFDYWVATPAAAAAA